MALTLAGGAGNDVLIGSGGNDTFLFTFGEGGQDVVKGFQAHGAGAQGDLMALAGFADHSFDQAVADGHIAQSGADVVDFRRSQPRRDAAERVCSPRCTRTTSCSAEKPSSSRTSAAAASSGSSTPFLSSSAGHDPVFHRPKGRVPATTHPAITAAFK